MRVINIMSKSNSEKLILNNSFLNKESIANNISALKMNEYYNDGINKIYHNDCLFGLDKLIENKEEIELTVTSPPYFNVKDYVIYENYQKYLGFLEQIFTKILTLTKPGRLCCVNISNILIVRENRNSESKRIPLSFHFVSLMEKVGWEFLEDIVWLKPEGAAKNRNGGFYQHRQPVAYKPNVVNEYIFVFKKPSKYLIDQVVRSYNSLDALNSKVTGNYERSNVWMINPKTRSKHPAPYPIELTDKLISYYSFVGDTVLDPFFGSGTTSLSSMKYNRKSIGFEIHTEYIDMFVSELKKVKPNPLQDKLTIDVDHLRNITKEECIKILMKNPKKMLFDIIKDTGSNIKNTVSKENMVNYIYNNIVIS
jgi:DNA modification methylase